MKHKWRNYALKTGKIQSSYIREYSNRKKIRKTREASDSDRILESWPKQAEEVINLTGKEENESIREEDVGKTHQERRQGIQIADKGRCQIEENNTCKTQGKKMKKEKESAKAHKKHEAKESKAYEKKEDKKEKKGKK